MTSNQIETITLEDLQEWLLEGGNMEHFQIACMLCWVYDIENLGEA